MTTLAPSASNNSLQITRLSDLPHIAEKPCPHGVDLLAFRCYECQPKGEGEIQCVCEEKYCQHTWCKHEVNVQRYRCWSCEPATKEDHGWCSEQHPDAKGAVRPCWYCHPAEYQKQQDALRLAYVDIDYRDACIATTDDGQQFLCPSEADAYDTLEARELKGVVDPVSYWKIPREMAGEWRYRPNTKTHWREWQWSEADSADWFHDADTFLADKLPPRESLLDVGYPHGATPLLLRKSLNEVYAYRGVGKSLFTNKLMGLFIHGGNWLRFHSDGGYTVALIDAELPSEELQERLSDTVGNSDGSLYLMTPEKFPEGKFPVLSNPADQDKLLAQLEKIGPDVVILDSLTATFNVNTNDPDANNAVNHFLRRLRFAGYCVVYVHHAGKTGLQRGRSDIEDHADIVIKLSPLEDAEIGEYRVLLSFEKKRTKGMVTDFAFEYADGQWREVSDGKSDEIEKALLASKPHRTIAREFEVSTKRIAQVKRRAEQRGVCFPVDRKAGKHGKHAKNYTP